MSADLLLAATLLWIVAALICLTGRWVPLARGLLVLGCLCALAGCIVALPEATDSQRLGIVLASQEVTFSLSPAALWLMAFGLVPAGLACLVGSPLGRRPAVWGFGAALSLLGAMGVFGLQDSMSLLIAWELVSVGGAILLLGEHGNEGEGVSVLFMLGLLEIGAVALLLAFLLLGQAGGSTAFDAFSPGHVHGWLAVLIGVALLVGFGAKLGIVPFYEWFPRAYGAGSGATGTIFSGIVLNAAFFALSRSWNSWVASSSDDATFYLGAIGVAVGVVSAVLAVLFAFQQDDWRTLLSFSSAENASVAVAMLGVTALFRAGHLDALAGLAWTVALIHLAAHALSKGALFLAADGIYFAGNSYDIVQRGWIRKAGFVFGIGAVFAAMSLASIPPQAGFVSEWYVFQSVFLGFHLPSFAGRLILVLAGAGLALAAAVALATFVKLVGLGLLGSTDIDYMEPVPRKSALAVGFLGALVLLLAIGAPYWLTFLESGAQQATGSNSPHAMVAGWLLVPLTREFAFISPSKLIIAMPLLALLPLFFLWLSARRFPVRKSSVWYGGRQHGREAITTALTFSNAMRTFYSFIYRPTMRTQREHAVNEYFISKLNFSHGVTDLFDLRIFRPVVQFVIGCASRLRALQSGNLNFYLALIGGLLIVILGLTLV